MVRNQSEGLRPNQMVSEHLGGSYGGQHLSFVTAVVCLVSVKNAADASAYVLVAVLFELT